MIHGPDTMRLAAVASRKLVCRVQKTQTDDLEIVGGLWCGPPRISYAPKYYPHFSPPVILVLNHLDPL